MGRGSVDVVIATREGAAQLARCLDAIAVQTHAPTNVAPGAQRGRWQATRAGPRWAQGDPDARVCDGLDERALRTQQLRPEPTPIVTDCRPLLSAELTRDTLLAVDATRGGARDDRALGRG